MAQQGQARDRATEETTQRRRRMDGTLDQSLDMKLAVPPAIEAAHGGSHRLRWFNDVGPRIYNATERDDWDKAPGIDPRPVGIDEQGKPILAHLLMKPKNFDAEDQARKDVRRREVEQQALQGAPVDPAGRDQNEASNRFAVDGNRVSHSYSP